MKEIQLNIPSSWREVTVAKFSELAAISNDNPFESTVRILSTLTDTPEEEIRKLSALSLENAGMSQKLSFLAKAPVPDIPCEKIRLDGKYYTVCLYPAKWTAGQYLDYTSVLQMPEIKKVAKLIACFTVPEGKEYGKEYEFDDVVDAINDNMPITQALGYANFFALQLKSFAKALRDFSARKKKKSTRRQGSLLKKARKKAISEASTQSGTPSSSSTR